MRNFYKDLPVLVTGGAGFIGSSLAKELVNLGAKVTVIDNFSTGKKENLEEIISKIEVIEDSITNKNAVLFACKNKKIVFHLAAIASVPECNQKPDICFETNIAGTSNMLEAARVNNIKNFIFSSSAAVYGNNNIICKEDGPCSPDSVYGYSKFIGEALCRQYFKNYNINAVSLRYFNVFSKNKTNNGIYSIFLRSLKENKPINIFGDGEQTRDFIDLEKIIQANIHAGFYADKMGGESINVASGDSISLNALLGSLKQEFNPGYSLPINYLPAQISDIKNSSACVDKLKKMLFL